MDERERVILETLDDAVHAPDAVARIERIVSRVEEALACAPDRLMAWGPVPLDLYGSDLPGGVRSSESGSVLFRRQQRLRGMR